MIFFATVEHRVSLIMLSKKQWIAILIILLVGIGGSTFFGLQKFNLKRLKGDFDAGQSAPPAAPETAPAPETIPAPEVAPAPTTPPPETAAVTAEPAPAALAPASDSPPTPVPTASAPVCGNGTMEANEECDDGPNNGPDGYCSATCKINLAPVVTITEAPESMTKGEIYHFSYKIDWVPKTKP